MNGALAKYFTMQLIQLKNLLADEIKEANSNDLPDLQEEI